MRDEAVTVIGGGPAGIAAAVQLLRSGLNPLLVEKEALGGLLRNAFRVENYPGFPGGISGPSLVRRLERQAVESRLRILFERVVTLDAARGGFVVKTTRRTFHSGIVVIATGTMAKPVAGLKIDPRALARVHGEIAAMTEASGLDIAIIGAGDAAMDYALNLSRANRVVVFDRGERPRCLPLLWERVLARSRIRYIPNTRVERVLGAGRRKVRLEGRGASGAFRVTFDRLVTAVGRVPSRGFLAGRLAGIASRETPDGRVHFIGDVKNGRFRQVSIAVGDGIRAAMKIAADERLVQGGRL